MDGARAAAEGQTVSLTSESGIRGRHHLSGSMCEENETSRVHLALWPSHGGELCVTRIEHGCSWWLRL